MSMLTPKIRKLLRYLFSGTTAALGNLLILFVLVHFFGFHYLLASILAVLGSMTLGFTLQKYWTFRDHTVASGVHVQFAGYALVGLINLCVNTVVVYVLVDILGLWYLFAQIAGGVVIAVTGYVAYHGVVFKQASVQL
ncbi:MAG: hypothetical protein AB199_04200 [Parcubacteria bacterium C7867-004]|nr:MAG: hypothetical protein AB199_04200 [Parcubacteria bacterium C7867-004]